jgi:hypothetical protein
VGQGLEHLRGHGLDPGSLTQGSRRQKGLRPFQRVLEPANVGHNAGQSVTLTVSLPPGWSQRSAARESAVYVMLQVFGLNPNVVRTMVCFTDESGRKIAESVTDTSGLNPDLAKNDGLLRAYAASHTSTRDFS